MHDQLLEDPHQQGMVGDMHAVLQVPWGRMPEHR